MPDNASSPAPGRGAPFADGNALERGFYLAMLSRCSLSPIARHFSQRERSALQADLPPGLADEIDLLRLLIRRAIAVRPEGADPGYNLRLLGAVGRASGALTRLIQFHHRYTGLDTPAYKAFEASYRRMFPAAFADFGQLFAQDDEDEEEDEDAAAEVDGLAAAAEPADPSPSSPADRAVLVHPDPTGNLKPPLQGGFGGILRRQPLPLTKNRIVFYCSSFNSIRSAIARSQASLAHRRRPDLLLAPPPRRALRPRDALYRPMLLAMFLAILFIARCSLSPIAHRRPPFVYLCSRPQGAIRGRRAPIPKNRIVFYCSSINSIRLIFPPYSTLSCSPRDALAILFIAYRRPPLPIPYVQRHYVLFLLPPLLPPEIEIMGIWNCACFPVIMGLFCRVSHQGLILLLLAYCLRYLTFS